MPSAEVTQLLHAACQGDAGANERLLPLIYQELREEAARVMRGERPGHTLQPTALVHETFLRLVGGDVQWQDRSHFIRIAARAMRQILVNHALARRAQKRGGEGRRVPFDDLAATYEARAVDLVALDEALQALALLDPEQCQIVECRFFGGYSMEEIARHLNRPLRSIERDWSLARAWLRRRLGDSAPGMSNTP